MHLHLLSLDTSNILCFKKDHHVPAKIVSHVNSDEIMGPDMFVPKTSVEFTEKDEK